MHKPSRDAFCRDSLSASRCGSVIRNATTFIATSLTLAFALTSTSFAEPHTTVFQSGKEGYHTYRIPALVKTKSGDLLAICEGRKSNRRDHGDVDLVLKRSKDNGKTWGSVQLIYEQGGKKEITIGNPCPVIDRSTGTIFLPFTRDNDDVFMLHSKDNGKSWSKPRKITSSVKRKNWTWYATGPGNGIQMRQGPHRGRLIIPCDHRIAGESDRRKSRSHIIYSDDHGKTWQLGGFTEPFMNECAVVELPGNKLMLNMRNLHGEKKRAVSISRDAGKTWSKPKLASALIEPICQASLIRVPGSKTLVFANPGSTTQRHRLTVRISRDLGKTWPVSRMLYGGGSAYTALANLGGGNVGLLYERDGYKTIAFLKFKP